MVNTYHAHNTRKIASNLNSAELLVDDLHHPLNLLGGDWPGAGLLPEQIHDMGGELVAALVVLLHLLLVDGSNLSKLVLVISVLDGRAVLAKTLSWGLALVRTCNGEREKGYKMPDAMVHSSHFTPSVGQAK